jgi:hypothetical protein
MRVEALGEGAVAVDEVVPRHLTKYGVSY